MPVPLSSQLMQADVSVQIAVQHILYDSTLADVESIIVAEISLYGSILALLPADYHLSGILGRYLAPRVTAEYPLYVIIFRLLGHTVIMMVGDERGELPTSSV